MIDERKGEEYGSGPNSLRFPLVTDNDFLDVGIADGFVWIRLKGKGSFANSPSLRGFIERSMESGETRFVIDLGECPAMDSTFMGTLAGLAMRLSKNPEGRLQLNGVCERNRESLGDLGLDELLEIDPVDSEWRPHVDDVRETLEPLEEDGEESADPEHLLEAHRKLCEASEGNVKKFSTVLEVLEQRAAGE